MDSFELNKIIGAILGTLLFVMGVGFLTEAIYAPIEGRGPGYDLPEPEGTGEGEEEVEVVVPIGTLLASANADQGSRVAARCQGCHNFGEGEGNKQGPGLYDIVGRQIAAVPGFAYSDDLAARGAAGEAWTYEHLNDFLLAPKSFAPGTKMNFGGLKNAEERANLIAYLSTLSANPVPFPPAEDPAAGMAEAGEAVIEGDGEVVVPTDADAVPTPTETQTETAVEGTPTTSAPATAEPETTAPVGGAAPVAQPAPAQQPASAPTTATPQPTTATPQ